MTTKKLTVAVNEAITLPKKIKHFYNFVEKGGKSKRKSRYALEYMLLKSKNGVLTTAFTNGHVLLVLKTEKMDKPHPDFECLIPRELWENVKMTANTPDTVDIKPRCFDSGMIYLKHGNITTEFESPESVVFPDYEAVLIKAEDDASKFQLGDKTFLTNDIMANVFTTLNAAGVEGVEMSHVKAGHAMTLRFTFSGMSGRLLIQTRNAPGC